MFQLIEKQGERKAVHSKDDLEYMRRRGWAPVGAMDAPLVAMQPGDPVPITIEFDAPRVADAPRVKRKYTKRGK